MDDDEQSFGADEVSWPPPQPRSFDISQVKLRECHGRAFLHLRHSRSHGHPRRRHLQSAGNFDKEYDSASDSSTEDLTTNVQFTGSQLTELQATDPDIFKRCVISIESGRSLFAKPLDHSHQRITIPTRKLCGHAFHGDEVLVEIFNFGKKLDLPKSVLGATVDRPSSNRSVADLEGPWAKVVGVFKRAMDPKYRMFVCQVEEGNSGVMVPLNPGVPKIFNLERHDTPAKEGKVTIYAFTKAKRIVFSQYHNVRDVNSILFVVRYLKWEDHCSLPLGIVVSVLPPGVTVDTAMNILDIEYSIPRRFCEATLAEVRIKHSEVLSQFQPHVLAQRLDYRHKLVFTIDPPNSRELDDALSFEVLPGGTMYLIGIHITDVSHYVAGSSNVDNEARQRGSSFYTAMGEPTPMLPPRISTSLCSLLPDKDRLTLSVYIKVNASADILDVEVNRSVVKSRHQLCYSEVEAVIDGLSDDGDYPQDLTFAIVYLNRVAQLWRSKRLGREALYTAVDYSTLDGPKAHKLVEEMMVAANHQVALYLLSKFPEHTALRCQCPPDDADLEEWKAKFLNAAHESAVLSRPYCARGTVCQCIDVCDCLPSVDVVPQFPMLLSLWPQIQQALDDFDVDRLRSLVLSPEHHPLQAIALLRLQLIQERSVYRCSGELQWEAERQHYSLNLPAYVQFTSPLRRYLDLVTHRLVVCALDGAGPCYSQDDITELCSHCSDIALRTRRYERANLAAHFCDLLMKRPLVLLAVVDHLTDADFQLFFPTIQSFFPSRSKIRLSSLNTSGRPVIGSDPEHLLITWSQRIYDCQRGEAVNRRRGVVEINADQFMFSVPSEAWTDLVIAAVDDDMSSISDAAKVISSYVMFPLVASPSSEGFEAVGGQHFVDYSLRLRAGGVVRVQLSTELHRGLLRPCIQLFHVTPTTCVCVEHITAAVKCFCKVAVKSAARPAYSSTSQYRKLWLPVLAMEAVHGAVANQHSVTIHHVRDIRWTHHYVHGQEAVYQAMLKLPVSFCDHRCVRFGVHSPMEDGLDESWRPDPRDDASLGYICVRYSDIEMPVPALDLPIDELVSLSENLTWVAHCIITKVLVDQDRLFYWIFLKVHHSSFPLPQQLIDNSALPATIEYIEKPLPDRSVLISVCSVTPVIVV